MTTALEAIFQRRAVKVCDPVEIPCETRGQILDAARVAPSSFNIQPYCFYWLATPEIKAAASLCLGQSPATTASALIVAVADIGSWKSTTTSELQWMRNAGFTEEKIVERERRAKFGKWFLIQGWFGVFGRLEMDDPPPSSHLENCWSAPPLRARACSNGPARAPHSLAKI